MNSGVGGRRLVAAVTACLFVGPIARAQDVHAGHSSQVEKPRIFWTTPAAVAFQLRRLSNAELLLVDRSPRDEKYIPVYETLLTRPGLAAEYRTEALDALVTLGQSDRATVLLNAITQAAEAGNAGGVLYELGDTLLRLEPDVLSGYHEAFKTLAFECEHPVGRRIGYGGLLRLGVSLDELWAQSKAEADDGLVDLLGCLALVRSSKRRAAFFPRLKALLADDSEEMLQAAAIEALGRIPGHGAETFQILARFFRRGLHRGAAVRALSRMARDRWPADDLPELAADIVKFVANTPPAGRTEPEVIDAIQLGHDIAARLSSREADRLRRVLQNLGVTVVLLRTVPHEMRYDKKYFAVEAGRAVQIILENVDVMPHNVVVVKPGAIEAVGTAAELMQPEPGEARPFIPESDQVLFGSRLVQPDQRDRLSFVAPREPGEYPYVCTFPGHWRRMYGVMVVLEDLQAWRANPVEPADPLGNTRTFVKNWTLDDFASELTSSSSDHDVEHGRWVFQEAGCNACHTIRNQGGRVGPDLTDVFKRWNGNRRDVLREILDPSAVVKEEYQMSILQTEDGAQLMGLVTARDNDFVSIVMNPANPVPLKLPSNTIAREARSKNSLMPVGLMNLFTRQEILDLLAYLESPPPAAVTRGTQVR